MSIQRMLSMPQRPSLTHLLTLQSFLLTITKSPLTDDMKQFFKKIVTSILILESKIILKKYKPKIVAVTGTVGKTGTKDAIYTVLKEALYVRKSQKSFNSEIGVPLTIIGCENGWSDPFIWLKNIFMGLDNIIFNAHY